MVSLWTSLLVAVLTVLARLVVSIPAGYALARRSLPWRALIMLAFLLPQAFPSVPIYINIARIFYSYGRNGTITGVVLVHTTHGLVFSVWIAAAAFAATAVPMPRIRGLLAPLETGALLRTFGIRQPSGPWRLGGRWPVPVARRPAPRW